MEPNGKANGTGHATSDKKPRDHQQLVENGGRQPKYNGTAASLPEEEDEDAKEEKMPKIPFLQLYRFADKLDVALLIIGMISAVITGAAYPFLLVLISNSIEKIVDFGVFSNLLDNIPEFLDSINMTVHEARTDPPRFLIHCEAMDMFYNHSEDLSCLGMHDFDDTFDDMEKNSLYILMMSGGVAVSSFLKVYTYVVTAEKQIIRMRLAFYKNIMRQEMGWFDSSSAGEMAVKFTDDIGKIHDGIGDKFTSSVRYFSSAVTSVGVSFYYGWELTLIMQMSAPLLFISFSFVGMVISNITALERDAYAEAGGVAEEVLSSIRTVQAFNGQEKEAKRYGDRLHAAHDYGLKKSLTMGIGQGCSWGIVYSFWGIGFWFGGKFVRDGDYDVTEMMTVFMSAIVGYQSLGMSMPGFFNINMARGAAYGVYQYIDKVSKIDSFSTEGLQPSTLTGNIRLRGAHFSYPTRPDVKILNGLDLKVSAGETVALVGASGCGKSTIVQLLFRFYDPDSGQVDLDGVDIRDINIRWLRQHIGLVGQEPVLFATSIAENIKYGRDGVTMADIIQACKDANAYDFISKMPDGFDTQVGERGAQLSGGQKQRIAIARALVKKPKILLLDEATSALDTESEVIVQDALDKASKGRTTLIIAHRLSTIRDADKILVIDKGQVIEHGTHDQLMLLGGAYSNLVASQLRPDADKDKKVTEKPVLRRQGSQTNPVAESGLQKRMRKLSEHPAEEEVLPDKRRTLWRTFRLNKPEWHFIFMGCVGALINGALQCFSTLLCAEAIDAFASDSDSHQKHVMARVAFVSAGAGLLCFFTYLIQEYMFGLSGEALTMRVRNMMFRSVVRQNIAWFDEPEHDTGILVSQLAVEASAIQGALKTSIGYSFMAIGNLTLGFSAAFIYGWRLALILFGFVPVSVFCGFMHVRMQTGTAGKGKALMENISRDAMESMNNIRTVASLTKEMTFYEIFYEKLWNPYQKNKRSSLFSSLVSATAEALAYASFAVSLYYSSKLLQDDDIEFNDIFRVMGPMMVSTQYLGQLIAYAPDFGKAIESAAKAFALHDTIPPIDTYSSKGTTPAENTFGAKVGFSGVHFSYPMRPDVKILNGLDISVEPGQTLALVGESGCGKSTTVQLVERFYDSDQGTVSLDSYAIKDLNIQWLRSQMGLVSQEPILFDQSIAENIAYGDNSREVSMDDIIQAAKSSNIHNFIQSLPLGYETNVGSKGTQLSGGQKQRIAIARALVRKPRILLLDEATSALDAESEKIVQEALDKARAGRTCITIAHRLSTIKDADKIAVFKNGVVHEIGTHDTLMALQGLYYKLQMAQRT